MSNKGIVSAAYMVHGAIITMPAPATHEDIEAVIALMGSTPDLHTKGFVDDRGIFLSPLNAAFIASQWGQVAVGAWIDGVSLKCDDLDIFS